MILSNGMSKQHIQSTRACGIARISLNIGLIISTIMQIFIEPSMLNISSVFTVLITSIITFHLVINANLIRVLPFPTLVIIGYNITYMSGALFAQTIYLQPLIYNLLVPEITFTYAALFQLSLLISIFVFKHFNLHYISKNINTLIIKPMGLMQQPTYLSMWLLGLVGLTAMALTTTHTDINNAVEYGDVGNKFLDGLKYLVYTPYFILIMNNFSSAQSHQTDIKSSTTRILLTLHTILLLILGTILNARGMIVMGITNLGISLILLILMGQIEVSKKTLRSTSIIALLIVTISPVLSDFATAVEVTRSQKGLISNMEMMEQTFTAFQDKVVLENYRQARLDLIFKADYNETYISNPFLTRFVNTKFLDNTLSLNQNRSMQHALPLSEITLDKILELLPTPIIKALNLNLDKNNFSCSFGDILYYLENGSGIGENKTGSVIAHGFGLIGHLIFIIAIPLFILVFICLQSFIFVGSKSKINLSIIILLQIMLVFALGGSDSLVYIIGFILRTIPQAAIIFALIYKTIKLIIPSNNKKAHLLKYTDKRTV